MRYLVIASMLLLASCANQALSEAREKMTDLAAECKTVKEGGTYKNYTASSNCLNDGMVKIASEANYPYMDLIYLTNAKRSELSKQIDAGKISYESAKLKMAEMGVQITNEEMRRNGMAQAQSNIQFQNSLQSLQVYDQLTRPNPNNGVACTTTGAFTNCRGY